MPQPTLATRDFQPVRMEVYQSINPRFGMSDPDIALVADKTTLVRVYLSLADASTDRNATVKLQAFRNGSQQSGGAGCQATRTPMGTFVRPEQPDRGPRARATGAGRPLADVQLPARRLLPVGEPGRRDLPATVPGIECLFCGDNNSISQAVTFHKIRNFVVKPYLITYKNPGLAVRRRRADLVDLRLRHAPGRVPDTRLDHREGAQSHHGGPGSTSTSIRATPSDVDVDENPWWVDFGNLLDWLKTFGDGGADVSFGALAPDMPPAATASPARIARLRCSAAAAPMPTSSGMPSALRLLGNDHGECQTAARVIRTGPIRTAARKGRGGTSPGRTS